MVSRSSNRESIRTDISSIKSTILELRTQSFTEEGREYVSNIIKMLDTVMQFDYGEFEEFRPQGDRNHIQDNRHLNQASISTQSADYQDLDISIEDSSAYLEHLENAILGLSTEARENLMRKVTPKKEEEKEDEKEDEKEKKEKKEKKEEENEKEKEERSWSKA